MGMFYRHRVTLWQTTGLLAGDHLSPGFQIQDPNFDDAGQNFLALFELSNTEVDGGIVAELQMGVDGVLWFPSTVFSAEGGGNADPLVGPGPHTGLSNLYLSNIGGVVSAEDELGKLKSQGKQLLSKVGISQDVLLPFVRLKATVTDGAQPTSASLHIQLISNGPFSLLPIPGGP